MPGTSPTPTPGPRAGGDRCPGALRLHEAADGLLARVRVPGGLLTAEQVVALADAGGTLGDGQVGLTSRGNVEIRGIDRGDVDRLTRVLDAAGLLPSATHERVRNVVASPAAGLDGRGLSGSLVDVVRELDRVLLSTPRTAELSGRFLFGLDDGRGDVLTLDPDIAGRWISPGRVEILLAGTAVLQVPAEQVARVLVAASVAFLDARDALGETAWRLAEVDARASVVARIVDAIAMASPHAEPTTETIETASRDAAAPLVPGPLGPGAVVLGLPLGSASARTWMHLGGVARTADGLVRTTPHRAVVVAGLGEQIRTALLHDADSLGLVADPTHPAHGVSACTGLPGCASSARDVRGDLAAALATRSPREDWAAALPVHVSGCDRRCGHPRRPHVEAVAHSPSDARPYAVAPADGSPATGAPLSSDHTDLDTALAARHPSS